MRNKKKIEQRKKEREREREREREIKKEPFIEVNMEKKKFDER